MPPPTNGRKANRLLAALPRKEQQHVMARCERVELTRGDELSLVDEPVSYAYFPIAGFATLVSTVDQGVMQVGMVGNEGMIGAMLALGMQEASMRAVVQHEGVAWRIGAEAFLVELERSPTLRRHVHRYLCVLIGQLAQNSGCARFHIVAARLARWLLMARDRAHSNRFFITHELLSDMLGVRRVGVTNAARELHNCKLISYSRGNVFILNGRGLEAAACTCYRAVRQMEKSMSD